MDNESGLRSVNDIILLRVSSSSSSPLLFCSPSSFMSSSLCLLFQEKFFLVVVVFGAKWSKKEQNLWKSLLHSSVAHGNDGITCDDARMMMMMMK